MGRMITEHHVTIANRRTRYLEAGTGWPLVLLHAFPLNADMWRGQLEHMPEGWRIIAPDFRGFGPGTGDPGPAPTMDDFADDVRALLDVLEIDRAIIGGLSMGGYVTFALLRRCPDRFTGVVLADTRPQADTAEGREGRKKLVELVHERGAGAVADEMLPKLLGATTIRDRPDIVSQVRQLIESNPPAAIAGALHAMMERPDSTADLRRISFPALIVVGEDDAVTPVSEAEAMHGQIPRSHLVVIPAASHLSNIEAPEAFSKALQDFLPPSRA